MSTESVRHSLTIIQQPKRARVTLAGEREKRVADPCPIVQLRILRADGTEDTQMIWERAFVLFVTLFDESGEIEYSAARTPGPAGDRGEAYEQIMLGSLVSSVHFLRDLDDNPGFFFCFPDIRVSHAGVFRLRFSLLQLPHAERPDTRATSIIGHVVSDPFRVYAHRDFPGVDESTPLTKKFAMQGVGIPIRNKGRLKHDDAAGEEPAP
ncbi:hypothetical protein LPJ63_003357 [Coemansia sp. RSA 2711]|nr:hypothetical protein LPJ63_003357 [Coemansia sp. RSA 2711]KAJ1834380.1 hypothetical protein LPJ70_006332 [Coemansia sp. RSA 2708]KAJ2304499.1 hypothetical protein IWW54_005380 [Coemansia sp. RSA 2705]KAJ2309209.1 hypothetical protein IWW52_005756 [Coemansia sp. RSA 2704]KAJ2361361.1 hypothetical protein H4S01_005304 [Coemansia sp. RSA 2610]